MDKKRTNICQDIIDAALLLAAEHGWMQVGMQEIAERAKITLPDLYDHAGNKDEVLLLIGRMVDAKIFENMDDYSDNRASSRDRLFDILMDRCDVLNDYRDGLISILDSFKCDPKQAIIGLPHLCGSMARVLEAAGISTHGVKGALKVVGLSGVYIKVLKTWRDDDSVDLSKTMAVLDKDLERIEKAASALGL